MKSRLFFACLFGLILSFSFTDKALCKIESHISSQGSYTGSESCRKCHERFYKLWATSHHGKAMQIYDETFSKINLISQKKSLSIKQKQYLAQIGPNQGWVLEKDQQGKIEKYPIKYVLGGKNIFYFLTPMKKGCLQTLPLAYDIKKKKWFDTVKSGLRHVGDQPVSWRDSGYTFNTSCHGCHVSQYSLNYDLKTRHYRTTWKEAGINCETCHGPGEEHIRVYEKAPKGKILADSKITRGGKDFTHEQNNATCSTCHAKAIPLTQSFPPGDKFWDHFDLATLEHSDYYPDARDLGENYTYTTWIMSPCVKKGRLDCLHCHTSSGRFRQKKNPNQACLPCHAKRVSQAPLHTRHKKQSKGNQCVSCHMTMTDFARMKRSDHSMLPPTPQTTIKFSSPNACNNCHKEKDAQWADDWVKKWHKRDYQKHVIHRADLIDSARKQQWSKLNDMLIYIGNEKSDQVFVNSLIRLLRLCPDTGKWPALIKACEHSSPLVRSSAIVSLRSFVSPRTVKILLKALDDEYRLVRVRAAQSLAVYPEKWLPAKQKAKLAKVNEEMFGAILARPDIWSSHYNLGNYYLDKGMPQKALQAYETAMSLEPKAVMPMVNASMVQVGLKKFQQALGLLERAYELEPANATVNYNLGLLQAERKQIPKAKKHLELAFKNNPQMAQAAYNLGLIIYALQPEKALDYIRKAYDIEPNPRYAFTLAYFSKQEKQTKKAEEKLTESIERWPWYGDSYLLLAEIFLAKGQRTKAYDLLKKGMGQKTMSYKDRRRLRAQLQSMAQ